LAVFDSFRDNTFKFISTRGAYYLDYTSFLEVEPNTGATLDGAFVDMFSTFTGAAAPEEVLPLYSGFCGIELFGNTFPR
jgi:hypothetical protein